MRIFFKIAQNVSFCLITLCFVFFVVLGQRGIAKQNIYIEPIPDAYVRYSKTRQFILEIKVNNTLPITYSVGKVERLPARNLNDSEFVKTALQELKINKKDTLTISAKDGQCLTSTVGAEPMSHYFCVYDNAGYLFLTDKGPIREPNFIESFKLLIYIKDKRGISNKGDVNINIISNCYPVDYLYEQMHKKCQYKKEAIGTDEEAFEMFNVTRLHIPANATITNIIINTQHTNAFKSKSSYQVSIKINDTNTKKIFRQPFTYQPDSHYKPTNISTVRVYGTKLNIYLQNPIFFTKPTSIEIDLFKFSMKKIPFLSEDAVEVYVNENGECPSYDCLQDYFFWQKQLKLLSKAGKVECTSDSNMYFNAYNGCDEGKTLLPNN